MGGYDSLAEGHVLLGKYRIVRKVGEGGMAFIYQAISLGAGGFERPVVIKVIKPELAQKPDLVRQFVREASVGAALEHPNIVKVFDLGEHEGILYIIMEYVAGRDLAALIHRARRARRVLGPEIVAFICIDICKALERSHGHVNERGQTAPVIHRDISPQNILLSRDGHAKLADFGMARALGTSRLTSQGVLKGKLSYMAPEQSRGKEVDARADLFSLGVVLWECLTGRRLFLGANPTETIRRVRTCQPPALSKVAPHVPAPMSAIVHRLLQLNPEGRFQTATELRKELQSFLRGARPVDSSGLADLLEAYFPARDPVRDTAVTELSFSDEGEFLSDPTTVDPPSHPDGGLDPTVAAEAQPPHTLVMFGQQGEELAAAFRRAQDAVVAAPRSSPGEPPLPRAANTAEEAHTIPKAAADALAPVGQAEPVLPGASPPAPWMEDGPPPDLARGDYSDSMVFHRGLSGPFFISLLIGLPLGVTFGLLVYWLLTR